MPNHLVEDVFIFASSQLPTFLEVFQITRPELALKPVLHCLIIIQITQLVAAFSIVQELLTTSSLLLTTQQEDA
jgi:hypothetical protein